MYLTITQKHHLYWSICEWTGLWPEACEECSDSASFLHENKSDKVKSKGNESTFWCSLVVYTSSLTSSTKSKASSLIFTLLYTDFGYVILNVHG